MMVTITVFVMATGTSFYFTDDPIFVGGNKGTGNTSFGWSRQVQLHPPRLSKLDSDFAECEGVQFVWGHEELDVDELNDLFELVRSFGAVPLAGFIKFICDDAEHCENGDVDVR